VKSAFWFQISSGCILTWWEGKEALWDVFSEDNRPETLVISATWEAEINQED
jgi:hypothetical protein